jgi:hypothetical protein
VEIVGMGTQAELQGRRFGRQSAGPPH